MMQEDGINVMLETAALRVEKFTAGKIKLTVRALNGEQTLIGSHLLVAAGRVPNTDQLNLKVAGVEITRINLLKLTSGWKLPRREFTHSAT
jgi:pyruvate/2-oxoglutarate dehydrogenase complex dihydrolipoamide dehydrogenase (E3) component